MPLWKRTPQALQAEDNMVSQEMEDEQDPLLDPDPIPPDKGEIGATPTQERFTLASDCELNTGHEAGGERCSQAPSARSNCEDGLQRSLIELQCMLGSRGYKRLLGRGRLGAPRAQ